MNIDWSKAPEGCTHHKMNADFCWYKTDGEDVYWFHHFSGRWLACPLEVSSVNEENGYTTRPAAPIWSGEGKPPVNVEIEIKHKDATEEWDRPDFHSATLLFVGKEIFVTDEETVGLLNSYLFRPLRTPEQIRDEVVRRMANAIKDCPTDLDRAAVLYMQGYRKTEG